MRQTEKLGPDPASARRARDLVRRGLEGQALGARVLDTALLLTSELVVDAALHNDSDLTLDLTLGDSVLRISVSDARAVGSEGHPAAVQSRDGERLGLVADLATRWGIDAGAAGGRTTWFELTYVTPVAAPDPG